METLSIVITFSAEMPKDEKDAITAMMQTIAENPTRLRSTLSTHLEGTAKLYSFHAWPSQRRAFMPFYHPEVRQALDDLIDGPGRFDQIVRSHKSGGFSVAWEIPKGHPVDAWMQSPHTSIERDEMVVHIFGHLVMEALARMLCVLHAPGYPAKDIYFTMSSASHARDDEEQVENA